MNSDLKLQPSGSIRLQSGNLGSEEMPEPEYTAIQRQILDSPLPLFNISSLLWNSSVKKITINFFNNLHFPQAVLTFLLGNTVP